MEPGRNGSRCALVSTVYQPPALCPLELTVSEPGVSVGTGQDCVRGGWHWERLCGTGQGASSGPLTGSHSSPFCWKGDSGGCRLSEGPTPGLLCTSSPGGDGGSDVKHLPAMWETWIQSLGHEDPLEEGMATHSSILAWRIPVDRGAWQATVHGIAKSRTQLSSFTFSIF